MEGRSRWGWGAHLGAGGLQEEEAHDLTLPLPPTPYPVQYPDDYLKLFCSLIAPPPSHLLPPVGAGGRRGRPS